MTYKPPNKLEIAATWLFGADYANSGLSAKEYYRQLSPSRQALVVDMVREILKAPTI